MWVRWFGAAVALLIGVLAAPAWAGSLRVSVFDEYGLPTADARVALSTPNLVSPLYRTTDASGEAVFDALMSGTYAIDASAPGYRSTHVDGVFVAPDRVTTWTVHLQRADDHDDPSMELQSLESRSPPRIIPRMPSVGVGGGGKGEAKAAPKAAEAAPAAPPPPPATGGRTVDLPRTEPTPSSPAAPDRMVHYEAWARLKVANPPETLEAVMAIAAAEGGRTDDLSGTTVTVRIPVARFDAAWEQVLALGDIMDRTVRADDVTDQYTATDLRARTLRATLARLVYLLGKATEEEEKLRLLTEITRVTELLDAIETQLRTLADLAVMSRITVEAVAREAFTGPGQAPAWAGFEWIASLSPFNRAVWADPHRVSLTVPDGMVALTQRGPFVAESSDGVVLWTARVPNDPVGSSDYWIAAIEDRLADEFIHPARRRIGPWDCLALDEPGAEEPYRWEICVETRGNKLHVSQRWFPGPAALARHGAAIDAVHGSPGS